MRPLQTVKHSARLYRFGTVAFLSLLIALGPLSGNLTALASIARELPFTARLTSAGGGSIVPDGTYQITFRIYTAETGGTALWTETQNVVVRQGVVTTDLGSVTPIPTSLDFNGSSYYLGIQVGSDAEMTPRNHIGSVPMALNSDAVDGASAGTGAGNVLLLDQSGNITMQGGAALGGALSVGGSLTVSGDILPAAAGQNIGSPTNRFATLYVDTLSAGSATINGTDSQVFTIDTAQATNNTDISALRFYLGPVANSYAALQWNGPANRFDLLSNVGSSTAANLKVASLVSGNATIQLPTTSDILVGRATIDTLTNKTLASPTINGTVDTTGLTLPGFTLAGGLTGTGNPNLAGLGTFNGQTISAAANFTGTLNTANGVTIAAGGLTVAGGAAVTGNSTIAGTLSGLTGLTVASGGASITGDLTVTGNILPSGSQTVGASGNKFANGYFQNLTVDNLITNSSSSDFTTPISVTSATSPQLSVKYDSGNGVTLGVSSAGAATFDATGSSAGFLFSKPVVANTLQSSGATITGGSINGAAIGASTPASGAFTSLAANSGLTVSSGGAAITGNTTISGSLSGLSGLTVASGGASITGAASVTGNLTTTGTVNGATISGGTVSGGTVSGGSLSSTAVNGLSVAAGVISSGTWQAGTVGVTYGGTGATSFAANGLLYGNGSGALQVTAAGTPGQLLASNSSGVPTFVSVSGDASLSANGVLTLAPSGVGTGSTVGTSTKIPQITYDSKGRITGITEVDAAGASGQTAGGDLSGTYPNPTVAKINGVGLGSVAATAGTLLMGTGTNIASLALSGDATLAADGTLTVADGAITSAKILNGTIQPVDLSSGDYSLAITSGTYSINVTGNAGTVSNGVYTNAANTITAPNGSSVPLSVKPASSGSAHVLDIYNNAGTPSVTSYFDASGLFNGSGANISSGTIANGSLANSSLTVTAGTGLSGGGVVSLGGAVTLNNAGVISLAGTANQVSVSGSTGSVTLSLPQSIATASTPTFGGMTLNGGLTVSSGGVAVTGDSSVTGNLTVVGSLNGATISGGSLTGGSVSGGSLSDTAVNGLSVAAGVISSGTWQGNAVGVGYGGTGAASFTSKGLVYGNGSSALQVTAAGTSGQMLLANASGVPTFVGMSGDATLAATGALTLAASGVTSGTYGAASKVPQITVDSKGRITGVTEVDFVQPGGSSSLTATDLIFSGAYGAISTGTTDSNLSINANGTGSITLGNISTGDVIFGTGANGTGCTYNASAGSIACSGVISGSNSSAYWTRSSTTIQPTVSGDTIATSGAIETTGTGTITSAGALTVSSGGLTVTGNSSITGSLGGLTGLTVASGGASVTGTLAVTGDITASGTINGATISGGTLSGGTVSGGSLSGTAVNGLSVAAGVVSSGTWQGTAVGVQYGGTGFSSATGKGVVYGNGSGALQVTAAGTGGQLLVANASGVPTFVSLSGDATLGNSGILTIGNGAVTGAKIASSTITAANLNSGDYSSVIGAGTYGIDISGNAGTVSNGVYTNAANTITSPSNNQVPLSLKPVASTGTGHVLDVYDNAATPVIASYFDASGLFHGSGAGLASGTIATGSLASNSVTVTAGTGLSGGGSVALGSSVTISNAGVTSITGTSNQISASGSTGDITLSLPQSIATSSTPTFAGLTSTGVVNASGYQISGTSINTAGTLTNVAYLNQANTFSAAGTALTVTHDASIGGALAVGNALTVSAGGANIAGGLTSTGGASISGGLSLNSGNVTNAGTINGQTVSSSANFTGTVTAAGAVTVSSGGLSVQGGIANNNGGITGAGAIAGASTITASGQISGGSVTDGTATLSSGALSGATSGTFSSWVQVPAVYGGSADGSNLTLASSTGALGNVYLNSTSTVVDANGQLQVKSAPQASSSASLLQLGAAIASGSVSGTYLGVNAPNGFGGDLTNLQTNGVSQLKLDASGNLTVAGNIVGGGTLGTTGSRFSNGYFTNLDVTNLTVGGSSSSFNAPVAITSTTQPQLTLKYDSSNYGTIGVSASNVVSFGGATGTTYLFNKQVTANALQSSGATITGGSIDGTPVGGTTRSTGAFTSLAANSGLTVSSGGITVTGASTITGSLSGITGLTVASGGATVTSGNLAVSSGNVTASGTINGATISGGTISGGSLTGGAYSGTGVTPTGNYTLGSSSYSLTLQGNEQDLYGAVPATTNKGLVNIGGGATAFDGSAGNHFSGNTAQGTELAINAAANFSGNLVDFQTGGSSKLKLDYQGNLTIAGSFSGTFSGGVSDGSLSSNVALLNRSGQNFTGTNTFSAAGTGLAVTNDATVGGTLAVTGAVTGGTYNGQTISSSASFTGSLTAAGTIQGGTLTDGTASIHSGAITGATTGTFATWLQAPTVYGGTSNAANLTLASSSYAGNNEIQTITATSASGSATITVPATTLGAGGTISVAGLDPAATVRTRLAALSSIGSTSNVTVSGSTTGTSAYAYVPLWGANAVARIRTSDFTSIGNISVGTNPSNLAITPDGSKVYVNNQGSGTVSVIRTSDNTVTGTITVGSTPTSTTITPDGSEAYVTNYADGTVSVIRTSDNTVTDTITVGTHPQRAAVTPDGAKVFVPNNGSNTVSVISTASHTVTATVSGFSQPVNVAITPDGLKAYVVNNAAATVSVITVASSSITNTISGFNNPYGIAISPNGTKAYVINYVAPGAVKTIDLSNDTVGAGSVTVGDGPLGVAFSPDGGTAYVSVSNGTTMSSIDATSDTLNGTITVGSGPENPAFLPATSTSGTYTVTFQGALAGTDVAQMTTSSTGWSTGTTTGGSNGKGNVYLNSTSTLVDASGELQVASVPVASSAASLVQLGSAIASGSSNGTYLGANAASGFAGNLADLQVNGSSKLKLDASGNLTISGTLTTSAGLLAAYFSRSGTIIQPATAGDSLTTSGNISTTGTGTITSAGALTVSSGGIAVTGNSSIAGSLGSLTTLSLSGAITGATATNTINGIVINSGALSNVTTLATSSNATIGGTLGVTGAITASAGLTVAANQGITMSSGTGTLSQAYVNSANGNAHSLTVTNSNASSTPATVTAVSLALAGNTNANAGANTVIGVNQANVTTIANNKFIAYKVGTGYDDILNYNGTQLISGTGLLQSAALSGTYSNALTLSSASNNLTVGTLTATGGTINGTSIGATTRSTGAFTTLAANGGLTVSASGASITGGINNNAGGITNAGAISGATTIAASSSIQGGSLTDGTATLSSGALSGATTGSFATWLQAPTVYGGTSSGANLTLSSSSNSGSNEVQTITAATATGSASVAVPATALGAGGTLTIGLGDSASTVRSGLAAISSVGSTSNVSVSGSVTSGTGSPAGYATSFTNSVKVFDPSTGSVSATVTVGTSPYGLVLLPDGSKAYVANAGSGNVSVIRTSDNTVVSTVTVGSNPSYVAALPDSSKVYVVNGGANTVSVINTSTNTVTATIGVGTTPYGIVASPDGSKVYVANYSSNSVSVISTSTDTVTATISSLSTAAYLAISPDGSKLYVGLNNGSGIKVVNTSSNTVSATWATSYGISSLAITPDGSKLYYLGSGGVVPVSTTTGTESAAIFVSNPEMVTVSADGTYWAVSTDSSGLKVYTVSNDTIAYTVTTGGVGVGSAISPIGSAYSGTYAVTFQGALAGTDVAQMTTSSTGWSTGTTTAGSNGKGNVYLNSTSTLVDASGELQVKSAPQASSTASLVQLGSAIASGSANGTYLGANTASGFSGDFANLQVNGTSVFKVDASGNLTVSGNLAAANFAVSLFTRSGGTISPATAGDNISTSGNISTTGSGNIAAAGNLTAGGTVNGATISGGTVSGGSLSATAVNGLGVASGVISSGTWQGTAVGVGYGGTGFASATSHGLIYGNGSGALQVTAAGTGGQLLVANSSGVPTFMTVSGDANLSNTGSLSVVKIGGVTLGTTANTAGTLLMGTGTTIASVALSGDATVNGSGVLTVQSGAITGAKIASATITAANLQAGDYSSVINSGTYSINVSGNAATVSNGVYTNAANTITAPSNGAVPLSLKPVASTGTGHVLDIYDNGSTPAIASYFDASGLFYGSGAHITSGTIANGALANSSVTVTAGTGLSGGGSVALGGSVTISNAGVTSVSGTTDQVNVSGSTGGVTFSLPQSIASTSAPTFGGLTLNGSLSATGTINGQTISSSASFTGSLIAAGTIQGGTLTDGTASISGGAITGATSVNGATISGGSLSGTAVNGLNVSGGTVSSGTWNGTAIGAAYGGTGQTSYTTGDLLYASASTSIGKLSAVSAGSILVSNGAGAAPTYSSSPTLSTSLTVPKVLSASGNLQLQAANGVVALNTASTQNKLDVYAADGVSYLELTNDGTNGIISSTTGNVVIAGNGGTGFILGDTGTPVDLVFAESAAIKGLGSTTIGFGVSGDTIAMNVPGVTYAVHALTATSATLTTSTGSSTALTINAPSGQTADLIDLQVNGSTKFAVDKDGNLSFGSVSSATNVYATGIIQGGTLNGTSAIQLGGTSINTAGTLSNVAYLNQANTFSAGGTALTVTNNASVGGTLTVTGTVNGVTLASGVVTAGTWQGGAVAVAYGGTGAASFTSKGLLYGNGTSALQVTAAGTSGQLLVANGSGVPTWVTLGGDATLAADGTITLATVNSSPGSYGDSTHVPVFTVDAKGRITAVSSVSVSAGSSVGFSEIRMGSQAYNLTSSYAAVSVSGQATFQIVLPSAGTYQVSGLVNFQAGGTANDDFRFKLYNATGSADIANSEVRKGSVVASGYDQAVLQAYITVTGATTVQLYAENATAARGTILASTSKLSYATAVSVAGGSYPLPYIASFTPVYGTSVSTVITGTGLTGATAVSFNGTAAASYTVDSDTQITATSPSSFSDGQISITTPGGVATSASDFTQLGNAPAGVSTGLAAWYKADSLVGLSNGDAVTTWADSSAVTGDATQSNGTYQPVYIASAINGKPAVNFNGDAKTLLMPSGFADFTGGMTVFAIAKPVNSGADPGYNGLFGMATNSGFSENYIYMTQLNHDSGWYTAIGNLGGNSHSNSGNLSSWTDNAYNRLEMVLDAGAANTSTTLHTYVNGSAGITDTGFYVPANVTRTVNQIHINAGTTGTMEIAELIIYNTALNGTDRAAVESYLSTKYGL